MGGSSLTWCAAPFAKHAADAESGGVGTGNGQQSCDAVRAIRAPVTAHKGSNLYSEADELSGRGSGAMRVACRYPTSGLDRFEVDHRRTRHHDQERVPPSDAKRQLCWHLTSASAQALL